MNVSWFRGYHSFALSCSGVYFSSLVLYTALRGSFFVALRIHFGLHNVPHNDSLGCYGSLILGILLGLFIGVIMTGHLQ